MNKLKRWTSELEPISKWWVFVLLLLVAVLVEYDNDPRVLESKLEECDNAASVQTEPDIRSGLAERYVDEWEAWWRLDVRLAERIIEAADAQRVPHAIAFGLIAVESGFDSTAISSAGAIGLTQVRLPTARIYNSRIRATDLQRVDENLNIGFRYYHDLLHRFDGDVTLALAAYNMGPTKVRSLGDNVPTEYSDKVLGR